MSEPTKGWKTYAVAAAMLVYAWAGLFLELHPVDRAIELSFAAAALVGLRLAIKKSEV